MGHAILFWCVCRSSYTKRSLRSRGCNNFCGPENLGYTLHIFRKLLCSAPRFKEFLRHSFFKEMALMKCKETLQTDCLLTKFMMQRNKCQRWHLLERGQKHVIYIAVTIIQIPYFQKFIEKKNSRKFVKLKWMNFMIFFSVKTKILTVKNYVFRRLFPLNCYKKILSCNLTIFFVS